MSQNDPQTQFSQPSGNKVIEEHVQEERKPNTERPHLDAIRSFFEDEAVTTIYSKENLGSESYVQLGHPCHGGYEDVESKDQP